jgi:hypothetical protein
MRYLPTKFSFISGLFALLLLAGCASNQTAQSVPDMLIASGFQVRTPNSTQQAKLQSLTAGEISLIQTRNLTLYVYPDWPNRRVLVGGPVQYQAYQQYRLSHNLPAENPPQVYRGPSSFDWRKWYNGGA